MAPDSLPSAGSSRSHEEARRLFDDYDSLDGGSALENQKSSGPDRVTPIPKAQLATLCAVRLVDPIAFTQIFPYVNEMMNHLHLTNDPSKIGFYSGIVVGIATASRVNHLYPTLTSGIYFPGEQFRGGTGVVHIPMGQAFRSVCSIFFGSSSSFVLIRNGRYLWP